MRSPAPVGFPRTQLRERRARQSLLANGAGALAFPVASAHVRSARRGALSGWASWDARWDGCCRSAA